MKFKDHFKNNIGFILIFVLLIIMVTFTFFILQYKSL